MVVTYKKHSGLDNSVAFINWALSPYSYYALPDVLQGFPLRHLLLGNFQSNWSCRYDHMVIPQLGNVTSKVMLVTALVFPLFNYCDVVTNDTAVELSESNVPKIIAIVSYLIFVELTMFQILLDDYLWWNLITFVRFTLSLCCIQS